MDPDENIGFAILIMVVVGYPLSLLVGVFGGGFGMPTFNGCVTGCTLTSVSLLPAGNPFAALMSGDLVGFFSGWFSSSASIAGLASMAIGVVLLLLGLGIGFSGGALTVNFSLRPNDQGTKMAQSFGIGLLLWGAMSTVFLAWTPNIGYGVGAVIYLVIAMIYFYGVWGWARSFR